MRELHEREFDHVAGGVWTPPPIEGAEIPPIEVPWPPFGDLL